MQGECEVHSECTTGLGRSPRRVDHCQQSQSPIARHLGGVPPPSIRFHLLPPGMALNPKP